MDSRPLTFDPTMLSHDNCRESVLLMGNGSFVLWTFATAADFESYLAEPPRDVSGVEHRNVIASILQCPVGETMRANPEMRLELAMQEHGYWRES